MPQHISIRTAGRGFTDITEKLTHIVERSSIRDGVAHLFIQHTSASLLIQENADPDVLSDLIDFFDNLAPEGAPYRHIAEGRDDMPAHIKSALTLTNLSIPIGHGALMLGVWQGIYVFEHRRTPHDRRICVSLVSEV